MATLRQYFETDFDYPIKIKLLHNIQSENIEGNLLLDVEANAAFVEWYIPGTGRTFNYFIELLKSLPKPGDGINFGKVITLPSAKQCHATFNIQNREVLGVDYQLWGDSEWSSALKVAGTRRLFMYSETDLSEYEIAELKKSAEVLGHMLRFRSTKYAQHRTELEHPLAFISHDSRDKADVARPIASGLQRMNCSVWYDEFSLKIGDHLRDSIEKGLRECKKCVLILSPHFFSNTGWTKKEFDSVFTREILEGERLVLPVWHGVTKKQVYDYSPSLLNIKGLDWSTVEEDEACQQLYSAISG